MKKLSEFDGGTIHRECPRCGQFCHVPKKYRIAIVDKYVMIAGKLQKYKGTDGCYANSYCKRCRKKVKLGVEFI